MNTIDYTFIEETETCIVYRDQFNTNKFYIHKWRVPEPTPQAIRVLVRSKKSYLPINYERNVSPKEPIVLNVKKIEEHVRVIRYDFHRNTNMVYGRSEPPFQSIYLPSSILEGIPEECQIEVRWL